MTYECNYYVKGSDGKKFFIGDKININLEGATFHEVTITRITSRGFYADTGKKADSYFRPYELSRIEKVE